MGQKNKLTISFAFFPLNYPISNSKWHKAISKLLLIRVQKKDKIVFGVYLLYVEREKRQNHRCPVIHKNKERERENEH